MSDFLGIGWKFPPQTDQSKIALARNEETVRQSIWMILSTARGERVMRAEFGCGIHDMVFAVNSAGTAGQITSHVTQALAQWEPRIDVLQVSATPDVAQPNLLLIEVEYRIRATNNRQNLVYPFYLE